MKKTTKGLVAGAAGAALLVSGATFALWSDSADVEGGTITAGNLQIEGVETVWQDVSHDRVDNPQEIEDLGKFRIVPGDTVRATFGINAALQGDNMVAVLDLAPEWDAAGELLGVLDVDYRIVPAAGGEPIESGKLSDLAPVHFASADNSNNVDDVLPTLPTVLGAEAVYNVVLDITFPETIGERDHVTQHAALSELGFTLTQSRTAGDGGGF